MTPHWTFDPDGALDSLIVDHADGFVIPDPPPTDMPAPDPFAGVDPTIPAEAVPADPGLPGGPTEADARWWAEMTREHCPTGVALGVYRGMCERAGLGPVGFADGFEPHPGDWPTEADTPLPRWADPSPAGA